MRREPSTRRSRRRSKEDAEAAAPSIPSAEAGADGATGGAEADASSAEEARANLAAVPPLQDVGPPTEAWQAEPMSILSQGTDIANGAVGDTGAQYYSGSGPDWIA